MLAFFGFHIKLIRCDLQIKFLWFVSWQTGRSIARKLSYMELTVKLQVFEGPLDLLLHLLEKNKVNIYDIPIVEITNQYMEYIAEMKRNDLNVMSEFLVMAATLIDIKSRMLASEERIRGGRGGRSEGRTCTAAAGVQDVQVHGL